MDERTHLLRAVLHQLSTDSDLDTVTASEKYRRLVERIREVIEPETILDRLRDGDIDAERAVLNDPARRLVMRIVAAAADMRPADAADDAEIAAAVLRGRAGRLMNRLHMDPRLCCSGVA